MSAERRIRAKNTRKFAGVQTPPTSASQLKTQKSIAKIGMSGSLGALFVSGFLKFHGAKQLHIYSGFGLLAFSLWHHFLNQPKSKKR
jgi:hypothetical protein